MSFALMQDGYCGPGVRGSVTYVNGKRVVERRDSEDKPYVLWFTLAETLWLKRARF